MRKVKVFFMVVSLLIIFHAKLFSIIYSRVQGIVLDEETNEPLKNVIVNLFRVENDEVYPFPSKEAKTNDKGLFQIDDVIQGKYVVSCYLDNYVSLSPFSAIMMKRMSEAEGELLVIKIKEGKIKYLELKMKKGGMLNVYVSKKHINGIDGFPDVRVNILESRNNSAYSVVNNVTDSEGKYSNGGLIPDVEYRIIIDPISSEIGLPQFERTFTIEKNKTTELNIFYDLTDKTGVNGIIQLKNNIVSHGVIYLWKIENRKGKCVFDGNFMGRSEFKIINIDPGYYLLSLAAWDEDGNEYNKDTYVNIEKGLTKNIEINFE